jgi:hypothetical protein
MGLPPRQSPRDALLSEHAPDLANLETPLRQLLVTVRYWDGEKAADIQHELVRDISSPPERTVIFNGLTQVNRSVDFGEDHEYIIGNLYYYLFLYFRQKLKSRGNSVASVLYPLLHECFADRLPIPKGFDRLLTKDDLGKAAVRKFCATHHGVYYGYRYGTSRNRRFSEHRSVVRFLIKIFPWQFGFAKYKIIYRGKTDGQYRGIYNRTIAGSVCVIGKRAHFIGQEDTRDHLSYMVWPHPGGETGPHIADEYRKGIVTASNPDEKLFSAQLIYRRISTNLEKDIEPGEIGVFSIAELAKIDDAFNRIIDNNWLENTAKELDILELDPIDSTAYLRADDNEAN